MAEQLFTDAVREMSDEELARRRRGYFGRTDSISLRHSRAVCDEICRRRLAAETASRETQEPSRALTRDQKQRLAQIVISQAANLFEDWDHVREIHGITGIDERVAKQQVANWLNRLPGDCWDTRLPLPAN